VLFHQNKSIARILKSFSPRGAASLFNEMQFPSRPGWDELAAVRAGRICEIPGDDILQTGFHLVHGYEQLKEMIRDGSC